MIRRIKFSDLVSLGIIVFFSVFSMVRFNYLPQFIDGYYHLSTANFFIKSGGWSGWAWWEYAPLGRPHLYPPFYHFILVFLMKLGINGLDSVRVTETAIVPLFFFSLWQVFRRIVNSRFSVLTLLSLSSFFVFYSSLSANVPASLAVIFGFWVWFFIKKKKCVSAAVFLTVSFYTHASIPWIFFISLLFLILLNKEYRPAAVKVILISVLSALPFLYHEFKNMNYLAIEVSGEAYFTCFSLFIVSGGLISLFLNLRKKDFFIPLFLGYLAASILVFFKYPYRLFSAQGIIGFTLFFSLFLEKISYSYSHKRLNYIYAVIAGCLFFSQPAFNLNGGRPEFKLLDSTYYHFLTGQSQDLPEFKSVYFPEVYNPIVRVIKENTASQDIIVSNSIIFSRIFSALTQRPTSNYTIRETRPKESTGYYKYAKLIIWAKYFEDKFVDLKGLTGLNLKPIYENDIVYVFLNRGYEPSCQIISSKISFKIIFLIFIGMILFVITDFFQFKFFNSILFKDFSA